MELEFIAATRLPGSPVGTDTNSPDRAAGVTVQGCGSVLSLDLSATGPGVNVVPFG